MGRNPRNTDPKYIRHISIRTLNAQLLLAPSAALNQILGGILAKYQEICGVDILAYTILGNHLHLLVRAPKRNLWLYEQNVNREISKRVNHFRNRKGYLWGRRYDEQCCPENKDALAAFLYVVCNPVSHGLVDSPEKWPGLNALEQIIDGQARSFPFTNFTAFNRAKRLAKKSGKLVTIEQFQTWHSLRLSALPGYEGVPWNEYAELMLKFIRLRTDSLQVDRAREGKGFSGAERVRAQSALSFPKSVKRNPRPLCYSDCLETKRHFRKWFLAWVAAYREASRRMRSGIYSVEFPENCLPPPLHYAC